MSIGEVNKGMIALLLVFAFGAAGYLWHSQLYKPAVATRTTAEQGATTAESGLAAAQQELAAAQQAIDDAKKESAKPDDAVARLAKARTAIPTEDLIDDAAIVLVELAERSGVQTAFKAGGEGAASAAPPEGGSLQGATPIDLEFEAAGTYAEMMQYISLVESTVEEKDGKLYTRGRLFNVVKLEIGSDEEEQQGASGAFGDDPMGGAPEDGQLVLGPNDITFTVVVRMYTSSTDNAASVGEATPDPAASATDAASGAATTTTDPALSGGAGTGAPGAAGTTDPNAATGAATGAPAGDPGATMAGTTAPMAGVN